MAYLEVATIPPAHGRARELVLGHGAAVVSRVEVGEALSRRKEDGTWVSPTIIPDTQPTPKPLRTSTFLPIIVPAYDAPAEGAPRGLQSYLLKSTS